MTLVAARLKFIEARHHLAEARAERDLKKEEDFARLCFHYHQAIGKAKGESLYVE